MGPQVLALDLEFDPQYHPGSVPAARAPDRVKVYRSVPGELQILPIGAEHRHGSTSQVERFHELSTDYFGVDRRRANVCFPVTRKGRSGLSPSVERPKTIERRRVSIPDPDIKRQIDSTAPPEIFPDLPKNALFDLVKGFTELNPTGERRSMHLNSSCVPMTPAVAQPNRIQAFDVKSIASPYFPIPSGGSYPRLARCRI